MLVCRVESSTRWTPILPLPISTPAIPAKGASCAVSSCGSGASLIDSGEGQRRPVGASLILWLCLRQDIYPMFGIAAAKTISILHGCNT
jgi:hypothetical protein